MKRVPEGDLVPATSLLNYDFLVYVHRRSECGVKFPWGKRAFVRFREMCTC